MAAGGYRIFRLLLPFVGFALGFLFTAQVLSLILNEGFLASAITIVGASVGGLAAGWFAYAIWWLGVVLAFAGIGFAIGFAVLPALGFAERDLLNVLVGVGAGVGLAAVAVVLKLPRMLVIVATSVWGAAIAVAGVMVLLNVMVVQWATSRDYELLPSGADIVTSDEGYQDSRARQPPPDMRGTG